MIQILLAISGPVCLDHWTDSGRRVTVVFGSSRCRLNWPKISLVSHRVSSAALQNLLAGSLLTIAGTKVFSSHCGNRNWILMGTEWKKEKESTHKSNDYKNEPGIFRSCLFVGLTLYTSFLLHFPFLGCITFYSRIVSIYYYHP